MRLADTIYLVDDDADDRMLLSDAIQDVARSVRIVEVENGYKLLDLLKDAHSHAPALIMIDMNMPQINGLELVAMLRQKADCRHIPVVMISTASNNELISEAYRLGINAFMPKPVTMEDFESIAHAINLCFLNPLQIPDINVSSLAGISAASIIVIEDSNDHWNLMNFAIKQSMQSLNLIRLRDKNTTLDFLDSCYKNLVPYPRMIMLDLYLPNRDQGLSLLESIRYFLSINKLPNIPVIIFSNSKDKIDIDACYENQANAYLVKPGNVEKWPFYFKRLLHFWTKTIRLPKTDTIYSKSQ
jgi:CheY-like chemotaxis protein